MKRTHTLVVTLMAASLFLPAAALAQSTSTPADASGSGGTDASTNPNNITVQQEGSYVSARIMDVRTETTTSTEGGQIHQQYDIQFRGGSLNGQKKTIVNDVSSNPSQIEPRIGDNVVINVLPDDQGQIHYYIEGYDRRGPFVWLITLFVFALVLLAGMRGLKAAFSIILSVGIIGWVLIPTFLKGADPVPVAIILAGVLTYITSGFSVGWNRKSAIAAIGTMGGGFVAFVVSYAFTNWSHLSGLFSEDDRIFFTQNPLLNPHSLLLAGIIIASIGIVQDVATAITNGVEDIWHTKPNLSFKQLFRAAMIVGQENIGTFANTLIFAYVGGALSLFLLFTQYQGSWLKFLNFDAVMNEAVFALSGTIGLVLAVPITALLAVWLEMRPRKRRLHHVESLK
jgi:uncharacterized membrane protein